MEIDATVSSAYSVFDPPYLIDLLMMTKMPAPTTLPSPNSVKSNRSNAIYIISKVITTEFVLTRREGQIRQLTLNTKPK